MQAPPAAIFAQEARQIPALSLSAGTAARLSVYTGPSRRALLFLPPGFFFCGGGGESPHFKLFLAAPSPAMADRKLSPP